MMYEKLLSRFTEISNTILQANLAGVYLHGSAAMGCFNPQKSDLDLIVIVNHSPSDAVKLEFMKQIVSLNETAPPKGLELSLVKREFCKPFVYPTPFELHFSKTHLNWFQTDPKRYIENMHGVDPDLAAHFTILKHYGVVLWGEEIDDIFGPVPKAAYLDSIWLDVQNARADIQKDPVYIALNLCRVLAYLREDLILSKEAGGRWGLRSLPQKYHTFLQAVLDYYRTPEDAVVRLELVQDFADYMLTQIQQYLQNHNT